MPYTLGMVERNTLLAAMWEAGGNEAEIVARLESGDLELTGNFKGREAELTAEAGDWEIK